MKISLTLFISLLLTTVLVACGDDKGKNDKDGKDGNVNSIITGKVIYGDDDRADMYQVTDVKLRKLASSTVALLDSSDLSQKSNGDYDISSEKFGKAFNLCASEPYREQDTAAFCSGFLVAKNIIVTAGHCIRFSSDCRDTKFVFDYAINSKAIGSPKTVSKDQVYSCKKILKSSVNSIGADFAVVELERAVIGKEPLKVRTSGIPAVGDPLVVIGHPSGLPTKVAGGAGVRSVKEEHFIANLDTYGGNSGSAVFNVDTGYVEGILVRGEMDFKIENSCRVSNRCPDDGCRGEDVTLIGETLEYFEPAK